MSERHLALLRVTFDQLAEALKLPEDARVLNIAANIEGCEQLMVLVEQSDLEGYPPGFNVRVCEPDVVASHGRTGILGWQLEGERTRLLWGYGECPPPVRGKHVPA